MKTFFKNFISLSLVFSFSSRAVFAVECPPFSEVQTKSAEFLSKGVTEPEQFDKAFEYIEENLNKCRDIFSDEILNALDGLAMGVTIQQNLPKLDERLSKQSSALEEAKNQTAIESEVLSELSALRDEYDKVGIYVDVVFLPESQKSAWTTFDSNLSKNVTAAQKKLASFHHRDGEVAGILAGEVAGRVEGCRMGVEKVQKNVESILKTYTDEPTSSQFTQLLDELVAEFDKANDKALGMKKIDGKTQLTGAHENIRKAAKLIIRNFMSTIVIPTASSVDKACP